MRGKRSKKERIWNYFKQHGSMTAYEAMRFFMFGRLAGYMCEWRKNGIDIDAKNEIGRHGVHYTRYYIDRKEAKRAEQDGLVYGRSKV